jgi:hypothetical protein
MIVLAIITGEGVIEIAIPVGTAIILDMIVLAIITGEVAIPVGTATDIDRYIIGAKAGMS